MSIGSRRHRVHSHIGHHLKVADIQAAIGAAIRRHERDRVPRTAAEDSEPSWFGYVVTVRPDAPYSRADPLGPLESDPDAFIAARTAP